MNIDRIGNGVPEQVDLKNRVNQFRGTGVSFGDLIRDKVQPQDLKISAHAEGRLKSRGIEMTPDLKAKLNQAVSNVAAKGGRDAAVITGDSAFIVNVSSRTVVTAMDRETMNDNVITNIDSATFI